MELHLVRQYYLGGTNGIFMYYGTRICESIELPWKNNLRETSCIPEGRYLLGIQVHPVKGKQLVVKFVPGRSGILIHVGNCALTDLKGCIAPVTRTTSPGRGLYSRIALERLEELVIPVIDAREEVYLIIGKMRNEISANN